MKKIAWIGCIGLLGIITTEFGIIGILPQIAAHYHISIEKAGTLLSAFSLVIAFTGPFLTLLASSFNKKKILFTAMLLFFISSLASSFGPPFGVLMLLRILPAFLQPVFIATAMAAAVASGSKEKGGEMMSIVFSGIAIAMVTTVPLASWLAGRFAFEYSYLTGALVSLVAMCLIYWGLPAMPVQGGKSYGSQVQILKRPAFILSTLMNLFKIAAWFSTYSYFAEYLNKAKHMSSITVSYMLFVFGVTGVAASFAAGKMLNRNITATTAVFLSGTLLIPVLLQFSGANTTATILVIALWGFLYAPCFLNASTYMISSAPDALEFANSLATSFGNLGVVLGTTLGGWVISTKGVQYTPWLTCVLGALSLVMILIRELIERKQPAAMQEKASITACH